MLPEGQGQSQPNHPQESPAEAKPRVWPGVKLDAADVFDPALLRQRPLSPAHLPTDPTESRESVERVEPAESADNEVVAGSESAETNDPARAGPLSDPDEEAVLLHTTRLLKDATGRLRQSFLFFFVFGPPFFSFLRGFDFVYLLPGP